VESLIKDKAKRKDNQMAKKPYIIHALSPVHAGTGQAADIIDLPIARMRSTGIPFIPGSSIKGVLRDESGGMPPDELKAIFGPGTDDAHENAGAIQFGDARLLALPVRSFRGVFAWVSSPLLLILGSRDLKGIQGLPPMAPTINGLSAKTTSSSVNFHNGRIYLEDLDITAQHDSVVDAWAGFFASKLFAGNADAVPMFKNRFLVVDDETMSFLWETATQVDTRVRLNEERVVARHALWMEESLPPETLLVGLAHGDRTRRKALATQMTADQVLGRIFTSEKTLQFGGKATVGRGRCRLIPVA
jgi:CRISPR-associated protein Cmr4